MASSSHYLEALNPAQQQAVISTDGPMLILAGAGSGKTRTITCKIAYLIEQGKAAPEAILATTFTNKAAEEMQQRVSGLLPGLSGSALISTFHSFAVRVLRRHAHRLGYGADFTICDGEDQKRLLKSLYRETGTAEKELPARQVLSRISRAKNQGWDAAAYLRNSEDPEREAVYPIFQRYQDGLRRSNGMDFDDLLLQTVRLFGDFPEIRQYYGTFYRYILIDEYQDTNPPQYELIRHLACAHQNVSAVGDEDQSIYGFRGADIGNILRFEQDFPGARVVKLEQNYRSTQTILDAATAVVSNNAQRKGKILWTQNGRGEAIELYIASDAREEARYFSHRVYEHLQQNQKPIAILYRTNFQSRLFEEALGRLQIPYRLVGGVSFYNRKEVKDALAYLRLIRNPEDSIALLRVINEPARGIGRATLEKLQQIAFKHQTSLWEGLQKGLQEGFFPSRSQEALRAFRSNLDQCRAGRDLPLHLLLEKVLELTGYAQALRRQPEEEAQERLLNLQELAAVAREYQEQHRPLQELLDDAALYSDADEYDASAVVNLMTLHNAKGLEFSVVFLAGCEEGLFPHERAAVADGLEEERRLCYVGLTRARQKLYLSFSRQRRFFGSESSEPNRPSRFLMEIPPSLLRETSSPGGSFFSSFSSPVPLRPRAIRPVPVKTYNSPQSVQAFLESKRSKATSQQGFVAGARVHHGQFGYGRILSVQGQGDDLKVTARFPGSGIKKLVQRYAKLRLV